jgi:hypothetical protein
VPQTQGMINDYSKLSKFVQSKIHSSVSYKIPLMEEEKVSKLLSNLDVTKSTGIDGVSAKLLKLGASVLTKSITTILNISIKTGKFPSAWKIARVTPIHKSGNKSVKNNYRPISILATLSKPLERHIHDSLYQYLSDNHLLYVAQSGFRSLHSCETALTRMVDQWTTNIENGLLNGVVLLDLRKAFDLVDTDVLLEKLGIYKCDSIALNMFKSYLQGRSQRVCFKGKTSDPKTVTHGVPQGSILGPLLFILFMNDLPLYIESPLDLYADDSTLNASGKTIEEVEIKLNLDLEKIHLWCKNNKMVLNTSKTKVMFITTYQKLTHLPKSDLNVTYNNVNLENVQSEKLLGVVVDNRLTWQDHVGKTYKTIGTNIALMRRILKYLPHETRIMYYKAFIQPHIDYCNTIWGQSTHVTKLHIRQKMALRLIMNVPRLTHSAPLFEECGIMTIQQRVRYRSATLVYKTLTEVTPEYMHGMFKPIGDISSRTTRQSIDTTKLYVPKMDLCVSRRAIRYSGAVIYNTLDQHTRQSQSLGIFKTRAYKHFM